MSNPSESDGEPALLNRQRKVRISAPRLRGFLARLSREVAAGRGFTVCLVSDGVMRRYNRRFRGQDAPADVLSFPDGSHARAGDLLISAETGKAGLLMYVGGHVYGAPR